MFSGNVVLPTCKGHSLLGEGPKLLKSSQSQGVVWIAMWRNILTWENLSDKVIQIDEKCSLLEGGKKRNYCSIVTLPSIYGVRLLY